MAQRPPRDADMQAYLRTAQEEDVEMRHGALLLKRARRTAEQQQQRRVERLREDMGTALALFAGAEIEPPKHIHEVAGWFVGTVYGPPKYGHGYEATAFALLGVDCELYFWGGPDFRRVDLIAESYVWVCAYRSVRNAPSWLDDRNPNLVNLDVAIKQSLATYVAEAGLTWPSRPLSYTPVVQPAPERTSSRPRPTRSNILRRLLKLTRIDEPSGPPRPS